jgi:hypothetical protein
MPVLGSTPSTIGFEVSARYVIAQPPSGTAAIGVSCRTMSCQVTPWLTLTLPTPVRLIALPPGRPIALRLSAARTPGRGTATTPVGLVFQVRPRSVDSTFRNRHTSLLWGSG